jgi:putative flippase GtrA
MRAAALYVIVQLLAYGLDVGTFVLLVERFAVAPLWANICAKAVAGCFAFFTHRHVTFDAAAGGRLSDQALRYVLLLIANSVASSAMLALFMRVVPSPVMAKIIADVILIAVSFGLSKSVVFRGAKSGQGN